MSIIKFWIYQINSAQATECNAASFGQIFTNVVGAVNAMKNDSNQWEFGVADVCVRPKIINGVCKCINNYK